MKRIFIFLWLILFTLCSWALSKIKTYSMQTEPFIHVDGDVFITEPLPERVTDAPLVAQNREIGTIYYRRMMDRILEHPSIRLPDYIGKGLKEESVASYNMGFFGGTDLDFIHRYCREVFRFMEENRMYDPTIVFFNDNGNLGMISRSTSYVRSFFVNKKYFVNKKFGDMRNVH